MNEGLGELRVSKTLFYTSDEENRKQKEKKMHIEWMICYIKKQDGKKWDKKSEHSRAVP